MTTSDTPMTDAKAYMVNLGRPGDEYPIEVVDAKDARSLERALTAEREKNAKLREEVLEEAALACEQYRSAQVMSKYARMSECQAARNAAKQCGKILRAMKEKQ